MARIESLTPEQIAKFPEYVRRWTAIGLSTEPANREKAEDAIRRAYAGGGKPPPAKIVWCGSPLSQGLTRAIVLDAKLQKLVGETVWDSVRDSVWASVGDSVRASVRASVWDSVRDSVWASVGDSVRASVRASVGASVWASVGASVWASVRASVGDSVRASVRASVWASVGDSVRASVRASVRDSVGDSVGASVGDSVRASVGASVWASVGASVWDSVRASVGDSVGDSVWDSGYGSHDAGWLAFYEYFRAECALHEQTRKLEPLADLAHCAGWWLPHENICWVSERHNVLARDERGRLHAVGGPAVCYPDGWAIYAVHGVRVPERVVMAPESFTAEELRAEQNSEVLRVIGERLGWDTFLHRIGAVTIDKWTDPKTALTYELLDLARRMGPTQPRWLRMKSPKLLDGATPTYVEKVHPQLTSARAARRWQFRNAKGEWPTVAACNKNPSLSFVTEA